MSQVRFKATKQSVSSINYVSVKEIHVFFAQEIGLPYPIQLKRFTPPLNIAEKIPLN